MMWRNIFIKRDKYVTSNIEYDYFCEEDKDINLGNKRRFYVLEEDIYSKDIMVKKSGELNKKIEELFISEFNEDHNYVLDNIKIKRNTYRIYAVRCGHRLEKLWGIDNVNEVTPIQYCMNKEILNKIKDTFFSIILEYENYYYLINYKNKKLLNSDVHSSVEFLLEKAKDKNIYYDSSVAEKINYKGKNTIILARKGKYFAL